MVEISVIITTFRYGGLDVTFNSLAQQTFKDFELIFVDELFDERKFIAEQYWGEATTGAAMVSPRGLEDFESMRLVYVKPKTRTDPSRAIGLCNGWNTGLIHANGRLVMCNNDLIWLAKDCLERHYNLQKEHDFQVITVGPMHHYDHPPLGDERGLITIFKEEMKSRPTRMLKEDDRFRQRDFWRVTNNLFPNCVLPLEVALDLNGFDERYDGGHGWQDDEFITRARTKVPAVMIDWGNENYHLEHEFSKMPESPDRPNPHLYDQLLKDLRAGKDVSRAPNPFDLRKCRETVRKRGFALC